MKNNTCINDIIDALTRGDATQDEAKLQLAELLCVGGDKGQYKDGLNAGEVAKKYGMPVGRLGCPHCGTTRHGAFHNGRCGLCGEYYFQTELTSEEWLRLVPEKYGLVIMDPDGWDRKNYEYSFNRERITKEEFMQRVAGSTCTCNLQLWESDWAKSK